MSDSKVLKLKPEDFKKKNYKAGDLIVTTKDFGERFGEVVDVNEDDNLEVYFIEPNPSKANGKVYEYCDDWEVLPKSGVSKHVCIPKNKMNYPKCYRAIGLRVWDGVIFTLWSSNEETDEDLKNFEFPTDCIEGNFNQAILIWVFFFIIPLGLIVLGIDFFKNAINNFKTLNNNSRAPFYL